MTNIAFPGLGIDGFSVDKVAFSVGKIEVRWYGILITLGIVLAFLYAYWRGKRSEGIVLDDVIDIGLWTVILGVIGARLYYVLMELDSYDSFADAFAIWKGGLAIYGGIIGGCIGIVIACKIKKLKWQKAFDMIGPGVMLAQAIGRWGNFFNGEAYGYAIGNETTYYFFNAEHHPASGEGTLFHALRMGVSHGDNTIFRYYHPTFLYECVWNIIGFVLINLLYKKKKFDGQIALMYFVWYGFGRMLIEGFRTDSLYLPGTNIRVSQFLGLACVIIGGAMLLIFLLLPVWKRPRVALADGAEEMEHTQVNDETIEKKEDVKMAKLIDGKKISAEIREEIKAETLAFEQEKGYLPGLAVVIVGENPASQVYVRNKKRACEEVGFYSEVHELPEATTQEELNALVDRLNADEKIHGILVQLPLPKHLDENEVLLRINPAKDVDAFHPYNVGKIMIGDYDFLPCTPAGVMALLERSNVEIAGKKCVVIGRSNIVGKPMAMLLLHANGTVTVCHSRTQDLAAVCREADILVVAIGRADFVGADMVKEGAVVIDVGMNRREDGKLTGDVDFEAVAPIASAITPVPGGVGPMTITMLLKNTLTAARKH